MITAKEAKQLYDKSGHEVAQYMKLEVEPKVTDAAKSGKRTATIFLGALGPYQYVDQIITPQEKAVVDQLVKLGYSASVKKYGESYVPAGLADNDGEGPMHTNYGIIIGW